MTRSAGSFSQSLRGLDNMVALRKSLGQPKITTSTVITRRNLKHIGPTINLLADHGADRIILNFVEPENEALRFFDLMVPRMSEVTDILSYVEMPAGIECRIEGIPLCLLPGKELHAGDREVIYILRNGSIHRLKATRRQKKGPPCKSCAVRSKCEGVWIEYARKFGWKEFKPIIPIGQKVNS
jgi:cyclic pyranopterin phosphate synthase